MNWSYKQQLPGILNTKKRKNEAERKWSFLRFRLAGAGGGTAAWRRGWLCKLARMQKKTSFFQELKRGQKAAAVLEWRPESVSNVRGILALRRTWHRPARGAEHRTSGSLGFRPGPRCLRCTTWCVCWAGLGELQS